MKKSNLENGMVVKSSGGRYGVVCLKDVTNENCIKFLYGPYPLTDNGYILNDINGIVSLDDFGEELVIRDEEGNGWWSLDEFYTLAVSPKIISVGNGICYTIKP